MTTLTKVAFVLLGCFFIGSCKSEKGKHEAAKPPRPVLTAIATPVSGVDIGFAGTIQPRYQTDRGFQVLGRLVTRDVSVGDAVVAGQLLASIDPNVFELAVKSSIGELAKTQSLLKNAVGAAGRLGILNEKKIVSNADFEAAQQARDAAAAQVQQAEANLAKAREQLQFTKLTADVAGVVTGVDIQVGQTVTAGKSVMTIARMDVRDAVVDMPAASLRELKIGAPFAIRLQIDPSFVVTGKLREIPGWRPVHLRRQLAGDQPSHQRSLLSAGGRRNN